MLNRRPAVNLEIRAIEHEKQIFALRSDSAQIKNDCAQIANGTEQIRRETEQLRRENARYAELKNLA